MAEDPDRSEPIAWPVGVKPIDNLSDLGHFGLDSDNRLYWNGKPVETRRRLDLTPAQKIAAFLVAAGATLGGLGGFATGVRDAAEMLHPGHAPQAGCDTPAMGHKHFFF